MNASWRLDVPLNGDGRPSFAARAGRRKSWVRTRGESMQRRPSADNLFALDDERLVDRAGPFFQSTGRFNISRQAPAHTARLIYWRDWFHSLVNTRTHRIVVLVVHPRGLKVLCRHHQPCHRRLCRRSATVHVGADRRARAPGR